MIRIEIKSTDTNTKEGVSAKSQKPYKIVEQAAYAHLFDESGQPKPYPTEITVTLDDGAKPYAAGMYTLLPQSVQSGAYGRLEFGRLKLVAEGKGK
jgi:hypothetical protein